ncbi:MAG: MFS transporter [Proteobacteria bacterium]|nr:MFS transporter [Pseudomonadota bacterium]MDA1300657.1 MFS transporter [Pseudomonadota bacterium]
MSVHYRWVLLFGVWLLYLSFGLVATSMAPLVRQIESDLGISHAAMGSIMGAWQLTYIAAAIPCGILLDRIGSRWALTLGGMFVAASVLARGLAPDYVTMVLAVMLFGIGGPIVSAGAPKVISQWFEGSSRGLAMGIYMTGPSIGGIFSLTLTHSVLLPWLGSWRVLLLGVAGFSALVAVAWWVIASVPGLDVSESEHRATSSLPQGQVLKRLISQPAVLLVLGMSVGVFLFNHGLNNWLPELLTHNGMTLIEAGYWAAIPTVVGIAGSLLIPRLAIPGRRFRILMGLAGLAAVASILLQTDSSALIFLGLFMQGIARSSLMTVLILTLVELPGIGNRYAGVASGLFFSAAEIGGVLGPLTLGVLYDLTDTFTLGLWVLTLIAILLMGGARRLSKIQKV